MRFLSSASTDFRHSAVLAELDLFLAPDFKYLTNLEEQPERDAISDVENFPVLR